MPTALEAARLIDISAVQSHNTYSDILDLVEISRQYRFINVHTLPCWTRQLRELLKDVPDVYAGAPVGFPGGGHTTRVKMLEAEQLLLDGVQEMDVVMNVGKFRSGEFAYVLSELQGVVRLAQGRALTKVIIELNALDEGEMADACSIVVDSGADFLKTGTGWVRGGANVERIAKIKRLTQGRVKVKAAGGIRTKEEFEALVALGVERFGINAASAVSIVRQYEPQA